MTLPVPLVHGVNLAGQMQRVPDLVGPQFPAQFDGQPATPLRRHLIGQPVREIIAGELRAPEREAVLLLQVELPDRFGVFEPRETHPFGRSGFGKGSGGGMESGGLAKKHKHVVRGGDGSNVRQRGVGQNRGARNAFNGVRQPEAVSRVAAPGDAATQRRGQKTVVRPTRDGFHGFSGAQTGVEIDLRGEMRNQEVIGCSLRTRGAQRVADPQFAEAPAAPREHGAILREEQRKAVAATDLLDLERGRKACDLARREEHFAVVGAALAFATASAGENAALFVHEDGEMGACSDVCAVLIAKNGRVDERERAHATGAAPIVAPRIHRTRLIQRERVRRRRGDLIDKTRPIATITIRLFNKLETNMGVSQRCTLFPTPSCPSWLSPHA